MAQQPALRTGLCDRERVVAVTLSAQSEQNEHVAASKTLWKIEASEPSQRTYYVVGQKPEGFVESVPVGPLPDIDLTLHVTTTGGIRSFHGEDFRVTSLKNDVLVNGEVTTVKELRRNAESNCSFLGLAIPGWVGWFGAAPGLFLVIVLAAVAVRRTRHHPELPIRP